MLLVLFLGLTHLSAIEREESLGTKLTYIFIVLHGKRSNIYMDTQSEYMLASYPGSCVWAEKKDFIHGRIPSASTSVFESHPHWKFSNTKLQMQQCDCNM